MSRINSLTNRPVKLGTRTYSKLIAEGLIDDGVRLRKKLTMYKVENHKKSVELNSEAYNKFINIGYTPEAVSVFMEKNGVWGDYLVDTLVAPKLATFAQKYEIKLTKEDIILTRRIENEEIVKYWDVRAEQYKHIQHSFLALILKDFTKETLMDMYSGRYGKVKITGREFGERTNINRKIDDEVESEIFRIMKEHPLDYKLFKMNVMHYIYAWIKNLEEQLREISTSLTKDAVLNLINPVQLIIDVYFQASLLPDYGVIYHDIENGFLSNNVNVKNCVIKLYKEHMESQGKADDGLINEMFDKFQDGFFQVDFDYLATKIRAKIHVSSPISTTIYGAQSKWKNLYITINNNHATASSKKEEKTKKDILWVDDIDYHLKDVIYNPEENGFIVNYQKGIALITTKKIYKNKIYKFYSENGVKNFDAEKVEFNFYSETGYYKQLFLKSNPELIEIDKSDNNKNLDAIKSISQHGIHYSIDAQKMGVKGGDWHTYDLKQAYTNYYTWPIYEGIPTDLDSCINVSSWETQKDEILKNTGFCLIDYVDIYNNEKVERWVSIPYVKMLIRQNREFTFKYALISRNKVNLNLGDFIDVAQSNGLKEGVDKRQWHKVIGSLNTRFKKETICTTDPLVAYAGLGASHCVVKSQDEDINLYYAEKMINKPGNYFYPHVSSYIQFYTEIMLEEVAFETKRLNGLIVSVWVDEITVDVDLLPYFKRNNMMESVVVKHIESSIETEKIEQVNKYFHTGKISKIGLTGVEVVYRTPEPPGKYSKKFNGILQNRGNKVLLTGGAGTGKTHISNELRQQMNIDILTPTHEAGQIFVEKGGEYETVASKISFIPENSGYNRCGNILVDECSMVNSEERDKLESLNPSLLLFTGDDKQLEPVEGIPMTLNLSDSYNIIELTTNFRQMIDPEFSRKLSILRLNSETDLKFGTNINEADAIDKVKNGGMFACQTNERVKYFNVLCNGSLNYIEGSRIRFKENKIKLGYHKGLLGVVRETATGLKVVVNSNKIFDLHDVIKHIELAYAMTIHKLQGKTLTISLIYDDKKPLFPHVKYTAFSRLVQERDLYILK